MEAKEEVKLYRPIKFFKWKDATAKEIKEEALPFPKYKNLLKNNKGLSDDQKST